MQPYDKTITPTPIITVKAFIIWFLINGIWQALEVCYESGIQESISDTIISVILLGFILTCLYFKERIDVLKQQLTANYPDDNSKPTMHIHIQAPVNTANAVIANKIRLNKMKDELLEERSIPTLSEKIDALSEKDAKELLMMMVMAN